ncbi:MAG TPA: PAS domain S-box protein, partial [Bacteroidota bacterium]|nr:PAS domain S-box protein [Bacteroidota bacterium]
MSTLRGLVSSLPRGEQLILCVPDERWAGLILLPVRRWRAVAALPEEVFDSANAPAALALARKHLSGAGQGGLLLVDVPLRSGREFPRERGILDLHAGLTPLLKKRNIRSLWIIRRESLSDRALGTLKDTPWFFIDCTPAGSHLFAQCITAREVYARGFFYPRKIDFEDPDLRLDDPALPGYSRQRTGGAGEGEPQAPVVDLLQEPYREMFRFFPEATILFDLKGPSRDPNPRASEVLGYQGEELAAVPLSQIVARGSYRPALRTLSALRKRRKSSGELDLVKKNGRTFRAAFSAAPLLASRGVIILRDVSLDQRRSEEMREESQRLSGLVESSPVPHVVVASKKLVYANAAFRAAFSWLDVAAGEVTLRDFLGKENAPLARDILAAEISSGDAPASFREEIALKTPEGERREYALIASGTSWNGKHAWYMSLSDVTTRNTAVHALRESERTFREICEKEGVPVSVIQDGLFVFANAACAALFGLKSPVEFTGKPITAFLSPRDRKAFAGALDAASRENAKPVTLEYALKPPEGSPAAIEAQLTNVLFAGTPAVLIYHRDITAVRQAEEELRRQARAVTILENLSHRIHLSLAPAEVLAEGLRGAIKWLGFESGGAYRAGKDGITLELQVDESLSPRIATALARQNAREGVTGMVWKTAEPVLLDVSEYPPHLPYRSLFESEGIRSALYIPLIAGEAVNGVLLLCTSKEAPPAASDTALCLAIARHTGDALANALRYEQIGASELRYRTAVESITDVVYECAPNGQFIFISPCVEALTGYLPEELIRAPDIWRTLLHPDERSEYSRRISNQSEGKGDFELAYRLLPKGKASYRWVRDSVRYTRDASGKVTGM